MTKQKVSNILRNPFYAGIFVYGSEVIDLCEKDRDFKPAVSCYDFFIIRNRHDTNKYFVKKQATEVLLRGMVKCGYCGNSMTPNKPRGSNKKRYFTLTCTNLSCEGRETTPKDINIRGYVIRDFAYELIKSGVKISKNDFEAIMKSGIEDEVLKMGDDNQRLKQILSKINHIKSDKPQVSTRGIVRVRALLAHCPPDLGAQCNA